MEEEAAETDPDQDVEQEDLKGKGKIPQRVRPDQPFALQNPHAPWPVVVPYGVPLHPDEPHSAGLVYLEDAERGREVFEREARRHNIQRLSGRLYLHGNDSTSSSGERPKEREEKERELEESTEVEKDVRA